MIGALSKKDKMSSSVQCLVWNLLLRFPGEQKWVTLLDRPEPDRRWAVQGQNLDGWQEIKLDNNYLEKKLHNNSAVSDWWNLTRWVRQHFSIHINACKLTFLARQTSNSLRRVPGTALDTLFSANNCDLNVSLPILRLPQYWPLNDELHSEVQAQNHTMDAATTAALSDSAL